MMNNSMNNGAANNNNSNNGGFIMAAGTMTIEAFSGAVKEALSVYFGDCTLELQDVVKNNENTHHGLCIREQGSNVAPTIYLDGFFRDYQNGRSFVEIVREIAGVYESHRVSSRFDTSSITDYERAKDRICFKLVNTGRNRVRLSDMPHVPFCDLSVTFYVLLGIEEGQTASVTVNNSLMDTWGIDTDTLFERAKYNTPRLLQGSVQSMEEVLSDILNEEPGDFLEDDFDGIPAAGGGFGMYVASNRLKMNGAAVFLYDSLLSRFADRIGTDFYILPSSIHELIFLPVVPSMDKEELREMVPAVNSTVVSPEEVLSDNVYRYRRATGLVEIV